MTVLRIPLTNPSRRTTHLTRSLSTFSHHSHSPRPKFHGSYNVGARIRHGPAVGRRCFHTSFRNNAEEVVKRDNRDYYQIMRLPQNATPAQIKNSYFQLSKELHPDSGTRREGAKIEEWDQLNKAYDVLSKSTPRREYDASQAAGKSAWRSPPPPGPAAAEEKPFDPKAWFEGFERQQKERAAPQQPREQPHHPPPPHELSRRAKMRRERQAAGEAGSGAHGAHQPPLEMGFRPRSSWDPRFAKFFDDWAAKMKEQGWDPTKTTSGPTPGSPGVGGGGGTGGMGNKPAEMMDANLLSEWIKHARKDGKDPMGALFNTSAGRGSAAGVWLKNRMAALDREEAKRVGGAWERGGARRGDSLPRNFSAAWGKGPAGSKRPIYSSDGAPPPGGGVDGSTTSQPTTRKGARGMAYAWNSADGMERSREWDAARELGGQGTGEETFNAPWDSVPGRGFKNDVPRPWWAAGPPSSEGKGAHVNDAWSPDPKFVDAWGKRPYRHPSMLESTWSASSSASPPPPPFGPGSMRGSTPSGMGSGTEVYSGPVKRDYSKGHQLDERYEEDKLRMAANERRMLSMVGFMVALGALIAAGRAAGA